MSTQYNLFYSRNQLTYISIKGKNIGELKQKKTQNLETRFYFFQLLVILRRRKPDVFNHKTKYICFYITTTKCLQELTSFKTCIILLSTWYGNQCRMFNLFLCVSSVFWRRCCITFLHISRILIDFFFKLERSIFIFIFIFYKLFFNFTFDHLN